MQTFELLIVFAALMAVIALVAIAIDWVGRPFKSRRFIARIYRYDDELADPEPTAPARPIYNGPPVPAYPVAPPVAGPPVMHQAPVVARVPAELAPLPPVPGASAPAPLPADATSQPSDVFQSQVGTEPDSGTTDGADVSGPARHKGIAETRSEKSADTWAPGMPLDARIGDAKPTLAAKAERFWRAYAANLTSPSHFDEVNLTRMQSGRPPTRRNPRTGDTEVVELVGLRSASHRSDVHMVWADDSVDPWSAS